MLNPLYSCNISAKIQKNIQKVDYMDGFCWQGELDLTLFYLFLSHAARYSERSSDSGQNADGYLKNCFPSVHFF